MGRNGKKRPVIAAMIEAINAHVGEVVGSEVILLGKAPGRNAEFPYLKKFVYLGYIQPVDGGFMARAETRYRVMRPVPDGYRSTDMERELDIARGKVPKERIRRNIDYRW